MYRVIHSLGVYSIAFSGIAFAQGPYFVGIGDLPGGYYVSIPRDLSPDAAMPSAGPGASRSAAGTTRSFGGLRVESNHYSPPTNCVAGPQKQWRFAARLL